MLSTHRRWRQRERFLTQQNLQRCAADLCALPLMLSHTIESAH